MVQRVVQVPISLLLDPDQTPSAKIVWMAQRLHGVVGIKELQAYTGLSANTVTLALGRIAPPKRTPGETKVKIPGPLLAERTVSPQAKVLYGLLQATPDFRDDSGRFTYASLGALTRLSRNTLKRSLSDLLHAGWIRMTQANQHSPVHFTLGHPAWRRSLEEVELARRRIKRAENKGEAIMHEFLSLLIDSDQFTENARPGFLVNPLTGERLELDRFYPPDLAFEYHGTQHDRSTERFSEAEVRAQQLRDVIKAGLCLYRDVRLVIIREADLSLQTMTRKIGPGMKLRDLAGHEALIEMLEVSSMSYQASHAKP